MLDKIHATTVFQDGFTRVLVYLDGSVEVVKAGTSIHLTTATMDELLAAREREMLRKQDADQAPAVAKRSLADALRIGGWFYFVGQIRGYTATFPYEGEQYIYVPRTEDNLKEEPVIPHNDVWIPAGWFAGDWYGPIAPPVTKERKALSDGH